MHLIIIGVLIAIPVVLITVKLKALKLEAGIFAGVLITVINYCGGIRATLMLLCAYFAIIILEKLLKGSEALMKDINKKQGARDFFQIFVNGICAIAAIVIFKITDNSVFLAVYVVGIVEALADSVASDVGILSKKPPRDICTLKQIQPGMSGGVSLLGFGASFLCCVVISTAMGLVLSLSFIYIAVMTLSSFFGCIADSVLGSLIQAKYKCYVCGKHTEKLAHCDKATELIGGVKLIDNCTVNLMSNFIACLTACLILLL